MTYTQFKLTNGDEIVVQVISEPEGEDINIVIKNAMMIVRSEDNLEGYRYYSLRPWMAFQLNNDYFQLLNYSHIIGEAKPDKVLLDQYNKSIEAEYGAPPSDLNDKEEIEMMKRAFGYKDEEEKEPDDGKVVPLFNKDKLH